MHIFIRHVLSGLILVVGIIALQVFLIIVVGEEITYFQAALLYLIAVVSWVSYSKIKKYRL
jgi:hypothetical protein